MADVFISYSSHDQDAAKRLRAHLTAAGYTSWMAPDDVKGSRTWAEQILSAIEESKVLLILVSGSANGSNHVANEVSIAFDKKKGILPVRVEDIQPTGSLEYLLKLSQWVDAFPGPVDRHFEELRGALSALIVDAGGVPAQAEPAGRLGKTRGWLRLKRPSAGVVLGVVAVVQLGVVAFGVLQVMQRVTSVPTSGSAAISVAAPPGSGSDPAMAAAHANLAAKPGELRWSVSTGGSTFHAPLVRDGLVYVGGDGQVLYAFEVKSAKERLGVPAGGGITGIPEVKDGLVYYPCSDMSIHAIDAKTGDLKWQYKTNPKVPPGLEWVSGPKADAAGHLVFGVADGTLVSVDAKTGKKRWSVSVAQSGMVPQPLPVGSRVFYSSWDSKCGYVDANSGEIVMTSDIANSIYGLPQRYDGRIYVRTYDGVVYALAEESLQQVWRANVGQWNATNHGNGVDYYPVAGNGVVCCPGEASTLFAFDARTGNPIWKVKAASPVYPAAISNGSVVFGTEDGTMYCVDAKTGKTSWKYKAGAPLGTPAASGDGAGCVCDNNGNLYVVPLDGK